MNRKITGTCAGAGVKPFQLLEINVISAQDLEPVSRKMNTYATAWMNPKRKLTSRVDKEGHVNPTWNDKFVFRVDDEFLRADTSAVQIEIHCVNWFRDNLVGSVRVLVGNLIPPIVNGRPHHLNGMRFVALQVRRPSGRPQGILNIGVALLDSSMRSMPLYRQLSASAVGYLDLMADEHRADNNHNQDQKANNDNQPTSLKPILRRTLSERSVAVDKVSVISSSIVGIPLKTNNNYKESSIVGIPNYKDIEKDGSIISISFELPPPVPKFDGNYKKRGKASSMINGEELLKKVNKKGKNGKSGSVISDSIFSKDSSMHKVLHENKTAKVSHDVKVEAKKDFAIDAHKMFDEKPNKKGVGNNTRLSPKDKTNMAIGKPIPKYNFFEYGNAKNLYGGAPYKGGSVYSDSEVGPSPSEVAAAIAERRYPLDEERSSVLDGWSCNESVEGLKSKLERWRTELPPIYDNGYASSSFPSTSHQTRRRNDNGPSGMFTCFGNIFGYECQCVCGKPPEKKRHGGGGRYQSSSVDSRSLF